MSTTIDNTIAFKILYMLVTPFEKTEAYKYGIIDKNGVALKKTKDLKTTEERDSYTNLDRLVFSLKRLLAKVPGGKSQLASLAAAHWLIKESRDNERSIGELDVISLIDNISKNNITFNYMIEDTTIANIAGSGTSTDKAVVKLNRFNKPISGILGLPDYIARRNTFDKRDKKMKLFKDIRETSLKEENEHYKNAQKHLASAKAADDKGDKAAFHAHMADHHDEMTQWHESKGRYSIADKHHDTVEHHMSEFRKLAEGGIRENTEQIDELSSDTLQAYKEKARKSADALTSKELHKKSSDRWLNIMKATGKQIDKTTAGIAKAAALNKEEVELEEGKKSLGIGWMIKQDPKLKAIIDKHKEKMKEFRRLVGSKPEDKKQ